VREKLSQLQDNLASFDLSLSTEQVQAQASDIFTLMLQDLLIGLANDELYSAMLRSLRHGPSNIEDNNIIT
jgi:hypothetical protein